MRIIIFLILLARPLFAATIEGKEFPDVAQLNGKSLVLNGVGLRNRTKLGMNFRVYVAGLYVTERSNDAEKLLAPGDKILELIFLRSLDRDTLVEAWKEAFEKNCREECGKKKEGIQSFNDLMVDVAEDSRLKMSFTATAVDVEIQGKKEKKSGHLDGPRLAQNLLAVFIGRQPPTEELKQGLLGLSK